MILCIKPFRNSVIFIYVGFLIFLQQPQITKGQIKNYFDQDLCNVTCGKRKHTLCNQLDMPKCDKYDGFNIYEVQTLSHGKLLELLISGHNGLRDRIANKAKISNMVKLNWDEDLAKMAIAYFKQCEPHVEDPCTKFIATDITDLDKYEYKQDDDANHRFIVQNRFRVEGKFFPKTFIESALRSWYRERSKVGTPIFSKSNSEYYVGIIREETNFTHLAYPLVANFGCSIAQIETSYELVCNYYPYYRTERGFMLFLSAEPTSNCPSLFPIRDDAFINLCGNGEAVVASFSLRIMPSVSCYILVAIAEFVWFFM